MKRTLIVLGIIGLFLGLLSPFQVMAHASTESDQIRENAKKHAQSLREDKDARIAEIKAEISARKLELKTERCEQREQKLKALIPKVANGTNRVKEVIDKVYVRVTDFYDSGQLTVENYDELVSAIELAKANAESSLEAVNSYEFEFDCATSKVGEQLDAYRTSIKQARESLKQYRKTVIALISGLKSENAKANRTDDGDQGDDSSQDDNDSEDGEQEDSNDDQSQDQPENEVETENE